MIAFVVGRLEDGEICDPTSCEIDVSNCPLEDLGGGYRAYYVEAPYPGVISCVVDARSGAIFSGSLAKARENIRTARLKDDDQRVKTAQRLRDKSKEVPSDEFWPWVIQLLAGKK